MNIRELKTSNFLKRDDVGEGVIVTITGLERQNVAKEGAPEELKWVMHFEEFDRGLVLNSTNGQLVAHALKSDESDDWTNQKIILFDDPSVSFGGKLVGGIRVRAVPKASAAPFQRQPVPVAGPVSNRTILKQKLKSHPEFNKTLMPQAVNEYCINKWGFKVDDLPEDAAAEAIEGFALLVNDCLDDLPFN